MDFRFLDMLHDAGDEDVLVLVGHRIDIDLDGVAQVGIDQHRIGARDLHGVAHVPLDGLTVVDDLHGAATQKVGRPDDDRIADLFGDLDSLLLRRRGAVGRLAQRELVDQLLEALAILGEIDRVGRRAEDRDAGRLERLCELERRLAAELHDQAQQLTLRAFDLDQLDHVLGGQRLEIEASAVS